MQVFGFIPAGAIEYIIKKGDKKLKMNFGQVSETLVHEDIIKRGIVRSVAKYLSDQKGPQSLRIRHRHMESHYYEDPRHLYHDYYQKWICNLDLNYLVTFEFQPMVAVVDFDAHTKGTDIQFYIYTLPSKLDRDYNLI